jgi:tetratricopeptide (TPR) repeat protein
MISSRVLALALLATFAGGVGPTLADDVDGPLELAPAPNPPPGQSPDFQPGPGKSSALGPDIPANPKAEPPPPTHRQKLDDLYARLAASKDADESGGLMAAIDRLQLDSGSSTGDLMMARAIAALGIRNFDACNALLDRLIVLQPEWAEAWNKRATVRYLEGDDQGSMADIAHVLVLEPRHYGALSGMGMILERRGFKDDALRAFRRALEVAPQLASVRAAVDRLTAAANGQSL